MDYLELDVSDEERVDRIVNDLLKELACVEKAKKYSIVSEELAIPPNPMLPLVNDNVVSSQPIQDFNIQQNSNGVQYTSNVIQRIQDANTQLPINIPNNTASEYSLENYNGPSCSTTSTPDGNYCLINKTASNNLNQPEMGKKFEIQLNSVSNFPSSFGTLYA